MVTKTSSPAAKSPNRPLSERDVIACVKSEVDRPIPITPPYNHRYRESENKG